jgi:HK97 family phage portal protein
VGVRVWMRRLTDPMVELAASAGPVEVRAFDSSVIPSNIDGVGGDAGVWVTDRTAMQQLAVYSCIKLLADIISTLPVDVFRGTDTARVNLKSPRVIEDPDAGLNGVEYNHQIVTSLAARGNSFELITSRDKFEYPDQRMPVHPDAVQVTRNPNDGRADYKIHNVVVPRADVIHIRRFTIPGELEGLSPIKQAAQSIGLSLAAERYGARFFGESANPSSVLETAATVSDEEMQRVMKSWVASHGGHRFPAFLSGGLTHRTISITPEESQFLATREFARSEIAMFFGIPPHMIGDTSKATSWGTGIEQLGIGFVKYTLLPWLRCIEATYSRVLLPRGQYMRFNVGGLLRGDTVSRYNSYTQARNAGWMSVNEIRALEDMAPIENGDDYLQPLNYGPLGSDPLAASTDMGEIEK